MSNYNIQLQNNNINLQIILGMLQNKNIEEDYNNIRIDDVSRVLIDKTIIEINNDKVTTIGNHVFFNCRNLTTASFPVATTIGNDAFEGCSNLTTASFPVATTIGNYAFSGCCNLTTASFPVATTIGNYAFSSCSSLTTASFPLATIIGNSAFEGCSSLTSLYLTGSSIPALLHINAFSYTPMSDSIYTGSFGSIFVPASLVASYKTATNWATYADRIVGIITFTCCGTSYQAEEGATWREWIVNNDIFSIVDNYIYVNNSRRIKRASTDTLVSADDIILANEFYLLENSVHVGGGGSDD